MRNTVTPIVTSLATALTIFLVASACGSDEGETGRNMITFVRGDEVYIISPDGSDLTRLTHLADDPDEKLDRSFTPVWSPDESQIAFVRQGNSDAEIWVMNADGSGLTSLSDDTSGSDTSPSWSPDGARIAFESDRGIPLSGEPPSGWSASSQPFSVRNIFVMNADGSEHTNVSNTPGATDTSPAWSADGSKIAFVRYLGSNPDIWLMNDDGSNQINLTNRIITAADPAWSPDRALIAFTSERDGNDEVYVMNTVGSGVTRLTQTPASDSCPSWSPDGSRIAFLTLEDSGIPEIHVMDADGGNRTNVPGSEGISGCPDWSPLP